MKHGEITSDNGFTYRDSTNSKVLDYLSEWYLFEKINKTVKMREKLRDYCQGRSCSGCKLKSPICRCGSGTTFMMKDGFEEKQDPYRIVKGRIIIEKVDFDFCCITL